MRDERRTRLKQILFSRRVLGSLAAINAAGAASGYLWYADQLAATPRRFWPFVPDSPLSATLFAALLLLILAGRHQRWYGQALSAVALCWIIKYGLWAVGILTDYWLTPSSPTWLEWVLWWSHLGMAAEGLLYFPFLPVSWPARVLVTAWLAVNDYVDYGLGHHPYLFLEEQWCLAMLLAVSLSAGLALLTWIGRKEGGRRRI